MEVRFAEEYAVRTDDELVRLWAERESLLPEAQQALTTEVEKRHLDCDSEVDTLRKVERRIEYKEQRRELSKIPEGYQGAGYGRLGRGNYRLDDACGEEEFDTIVFVFFLFFPVWPHQAYRIRQSTAEHRWRILERIPIPWPAVRLIWARSAFFAALVFLVLTLFWNGLQHGFVSLMRLIFR